MPMSTATSLFIIQKAEYRKRYEFCLAHHPNAGTPFANLAELLGLVNTK